MATPKPVSRKLRDMLGAEVAETMVAWLDGLEDRRDLLREEIRADMAELRQEIAALRAEMRTALADQMKWMIGFWLTSLLAVIGALLTLGRRP